MRFSIFHLICFFTISVSGQRPSNGIYFGHKSPFTICYFVVSDSTMEVEYFFKKAGQVFDHFPSRRIFIYPDTLKKKYSLKSSDDSIEVITKRDFLQIKKRKFSDVKVYRSSVSSFTEIEILRNQYSLLMFSRGLFEELKSSKDFDSLAFRNKLSSYELENKLSTGEKEFNSLLNEVGKNIKEEFRKE